MILDSAADALLSASSSRPPFLSTLPGRGWFDRQRVVVALIALLALAPVLFILERTAEGRRNVVYWDEFDTALALVLKLKDGTTPGAFLNQLFSLSNEHRIVTSRLMFATSYWLTGTVNFTFINILGNASIVALCILLVISAGTTMRRLRLGALLVCLLFQLEHYENFLWSGASIDHFQVVLLAAAAIVALARNSRAGVLAGGLFATLATFTLAHGILVWPVGAAMLWRAGDRRRLALWGGLGAVVVGGFLAGFQLNHAQQFAGWSVAGALQIAHYWLTLLGAVPALGNDALAPWLGAVLPAALGWLACHRASRREPIAFALAVYAIAALALIAVGRAAESGGVAYSRYFVLGAVAWALTAFMALERYSHPRRPLVLIGLALPALVAFNLAANRAFSSKADAWLECRDLAVTRYTQHGVDGRGPFTLHPLPAHSTALLNEAERAGIYRMGPLCLARDFPGDAVESSRIVYFVDTMTVSARSAYIDGWAAIPGERSERGQIHVLLRAGKETHMFTAVTETRTDVAQATKKPGWELSGFRFALRRDRLPTGEFQLGFLVEYDDGVEFIMTAHKLVLIGEGEALLATAD